MGSHRVGHDWSDLAAARWKKIPAWSTHYILVAWSLVYKNISNWIVSLFSVPHFPSSVLSAKSLQSCPTLCDPIDGSPPGFPVPGILQVRTLEWVAISFSNAWKWKVKVKSLSHFWPSATPWTAAFQAPPSMRFSRQEYWSGVPLPSPSLVQVDCKYGKVVNYSHSPVPCKNES